jgi:hypothetical protein
MGRYCAECQFECDDHQFTNNQWRKGPGYSRCSDCSSGNPIQCHICDRYFGNRNNLKMHMQVHRPRSVACPICGEERFRNGANAVQHVESGSCRGCRGSQESARRQIYDFACQNRKMHRFLMDVPRLTYGGSSYDQEEVPDFPYHCPDCYKYFRQLSQLLQHQDNKHSRNYLRIGYLKETFNGKGRKVGREKGGGGRILPIQFQFQFVLSYQRSSPSQSDKVGSRKIYSVQDSFDLGPCLRILRNIHVILSEIL